MKISVAMATFNGERFLVEQLESLAAQSRVPDELVVSDDCSSDRTRDVVAEFARSAPFPVSIFRNDKPLGYADNFLRAAQLCKGDWIAFCDQDDVWMPGKLATIEKYFEIPGRDVMLIAHSAAVVDADLRGMTSRRPDISRFRVCRGTELPASWYVEGLAISFRGDLVRELSPSGRGPDGGKPMLPLAHDVWVCRLARILGDIVLLPDSLCLYRRHLATATTAYRGQSARSGRLHRIVGTLSAALESGAREYKNYSVSLEYQAKAFGRLARLELNPVRCERLLDAESEFEKFSRWMGIRARLYTESGILGRVRLLRDLASGRSYGRFMSSRAFAKDFVTAIVGGECVSRRRST